MNILKHTYLCVKDPKRLFFGLNARNMTNWMPDGLYLKLRYYFVTGKKLNLRNPRSFNEKIQWLKLHDRRPCYTTLADKYAVRQYVQDCVGEEFLVPLLGVWNHADDIDFASLPEQFVLKTTHDGGVIICEDKQQLNLPETRSKLTQKMERNYFYSGREWCYKNIKPRIIAEQYMGNDLADYKFMVFQGQVRCIFTCTERNSAGLKVTFFDRNWERMPFERQYPVSSVPIPKPINFDRMVAMAERLAGDIPFVRVDMFEINQHIYVGEMTFYPGGGMEAFRPEEWDYTLGSWLVLPNK